ncbi:hypothetical protein [Bathymodiolus japonicus methanotrophic gill symbiont]|uniref:hypothetical protein n=1 Tax=Bathymodiolus japonicus methanotrophic gill symbiont TaxID=113269 RepID=UPI001C8E3213|nr:hypothetical protein [Bathymodiolus japonicus methanotrophic gill symbiont]
MAFYFVSTFANAQTPTKQRPYGYRGLKIITSLRLRFPDFQRLCKPGYEPVFFFAQGVSNFFIVSVIFYLGRT